MDRYCLDWMNIKADNKLEQVRGTEDVVTSRSIRSWSSKTCGLLIGTAPKSPIGTYVKNLISIKATEES
eukprot:2650469-Karenia_brevis.AAC.1